MHFTDFLKGENIKLKILLNLFTTDMQEKDFIELSEPFNQEGYLVLNFQFSLSEYYLVIIQTLMDYLSSEHKISQYESSIVIQSNISNLLIAWYRLYNDVIDDFVLVDKNIATFHSNDVVEERFVKKLSSFIAYEHDICHKRIYYRYSKAINLNVLQRFMGSYQYDLLKPFEELDLNAVYQKRKFEKEYRFDNRSYKRISVGEKIDQVIDLSQEKVEQNNIRINEITQPAGYYFVFHYILNLPIQDLQKAKIVTMLNQQMTDEDKRKVSEFIHNYLQVTEGEHSFKQVINFYSFLVMLGTDKTAMKKMLKYIKKDKSHLDDHYAPFTNALFYITKANQKEYEDYFLDRVEIMRELKAYYKPKLQIKAQKSENHLVIVTGQLLSYNHSPTKLAIDYANHLVQYYSKLKIKIVVEDMFKYSPNELFFVYPFSSADSSTLGKEHKKLLHPSIEVYYSNSSLSRKRRLQEDIKAITNFGPTWILKVGAPDSLLVDQLYDYYPVSSGSMGGAEYSEFVDVGYSGRNVEQVLKERKEKGLSNEKFIYEHHNPGLAFPIVNSKIKRADYNMSKDDFIIVTVGNRLDAEIDSKFAEGMRKLLQKYSNIKWLLIGIEQHKIINSTFQDVFNQVKFISYAQNLMDVYSISDVYANPFREGGGISIAMAMEAGLPVANLIGKNDGNVYVPEGKAQPLKSYFNYIEQLSIQRAFYLNESQIFQKKIREKFGFEGATAHIMQILEKSSTVYLERELFEKGN